VSEMVRYRLLPRGAFHFGERGVGMEVTDITLRADSFFAALCLALRDMYGAEWLEETFLPAFPTARHDVVPPFRLTSLFPFVGDVFFLPRPLVRPMWPDLETEMQWRKKAKAAYVSQQVFDYLVSGRALDEQVLPADDKEAGKYFIQGTWLAQGEYERVEGFKDYRGRIRFWETEEAPRVTVDRRSSASAYYLTGRLVFHRRPSDDGERVAGLYFLIEWLNGDDEMRKRVEAGLHALSDIGIGGERSAGYGQFELAVDPAHPTPPAATRVPYFTTLAPYYPRPDELKPEGGVLGQSAAYDLLLRRGWMSSPDASNLRRKTVRLVGEGAVLHTLPGRESYGALADATPDIFDPDQNSRGHKVYRYGLAFPVGLTAGSVSDSKDADKRG
jgi:CRISPR-associated protein Csm4